MEIFLDREAMRQIRSATNEAIEEGDVEALCQDIIDVLPEEQIEALDAAGGTDVLDLIAEVLDEWSGDDVDEMFELLEGHLADHGIDLKYEAAEGLHDDDDDDDDDFSNDFDSL